VEKKTTEEKKKPKGDKITVKRSGEPPNQRVKARLTPPMKERMVFIAEATSLHGRRTEKGKGQKKGTEV